MVNWRGTHCFSGFGCGRGTGRGAGGREAGRGVSCGLGKARGLEEACGREELKMEPRKLDGRSGRLTEAVLSTRCATYGDGGGSCSKGRDLRALV